MFDVCVRVCTVRCAVASIPAYAWVCFLMGSLCRRTFLDMPGRSAVLHRTSWQVHRNSGADCEILLDRRRIAPTRTSPLHRCARSLRKGFSNRSYSTLTRTCKCIMGERAAYVIPLVVRFSIPKLCCLTFRCDVLPCDPSSVIKQRDSFRHKMQSCLAELFSNIDVSADDQLHTLLNMVTGNFGMLRKRSQES